LIGDPFFRRNLPHWQPLGATFFVTYRLAGTLPRVVLSKLERERQRLATLPRDPEFSEAKWKESIDKRLFATWDEYLDKDTGVKWLSDPRVAKIVKDTLYYHAGTKYSLWAYVIMPNHVHVMLHPDENWFQYGNRKKAQYEKGSLSAILHSLRCYTANEANKVLGRTGRFWQGEAFDHWVRDDTEFQRTVHYIENNPVRAGLVKSPGDWEFSSMYDRIQKGIGAFDRLA